MADNEKKPNPLAKKAEDKPAPKQVVTLAEIKAKITACEQYKNEHLGKPGMNAALWFSKNVWPVKHLVDAIASGEQEAPEDMSAFKSVRNFMKLEFPEAPTPAKDKGPQVKRANSAKPGSGYVGEDGPGPKPGLDQVTTK